MISWFRAVMLAGVVIVPGPSPEQPGTLLAGAAKVDITPPADAAVPMSGYANRTEGFKGIHDRIYARAIVVSDGIRQAALVSWELSHHHLTKVSPFSRTVMVTHANGSSGYIPDDAAFEQVSYEIESSRLNPGCAENAIVNGFLRLIAERP